MRMLRLRGECQAPPIGLEYELQRFQSFSVDPSGRKYSWNDAEEDGGKKDHFRLCGRPLTGPQYSQTFSSTPLLLRLLRTPGLESPSSLSTPRSSPSAEIIIIIKYFPHSPCGTDLF